METRFTRDLRGAARSIAALVSLATTALPAAALDYDGGTLLDLPPRGWADPLHRNDHAPRGDARDGRAGTERASALRVSDGAVVYAADIPADRFVTCERATRHDGRRLPRC